jgi:hypothetical protein
MIKNILATLFFTFLSYAIISDIGKPQHTYHLPSVAAIAD